MLIVGKKRLRKPNVNIGRGSGAGTIVVTPEGEIERIFES